MLHILNGESTLALLKQTSLKGPYLVWPDMLMEGPVQETAAGELDWKARAAYLKDRFGIDPKSYLKRILGFFSTLEKAVEDDTEITFWFEEDFFCQIHLIYLLAHLPAPLLRKGRVSLICPEKPLGIRLPGALEKLFKQKVDLEPARVTLARKVWKAYSLGSAKGWETLLHWAQAGTGFAPWPLLQKGLRCHLGRRPAPNGGLNALEAAMLRALSHGSVGFPQFFRRTWVEPDVRPLGLGDIQIARYALDFAGQGLPLMKIEGPGSAWTPGKSIVTKDWKLSLTTEGKNLFEPKGAAPKSPTKGAVKKAVKKKTAKKARRKA